MKYSDRNTTVEPDACKYPISQCLSQCYKSNAFTVFRMMRNPPSLCYNKKRKQGPPEGEGRGLVTHSY